MKITELKKKVILLEGKSAGFLSKKKAYTVKDENELGYLIGNTWYPKIVFGIYIEPSSIQFEGKTYTSGGSTSSKPERDWAKPQAFPKGYVVPDGTKISQFVNHNGSALVLRNGIVIQSGLLPIVKWFLSGHKSYVHSICLAPLNPTDHPEHPEFGKAKESEGKPLRLVTDLGDNECIHCPTEREAEAICKLMYVAGLKWRPSEIHHEKDNRWYVYAADSVYYPSKGIYGNVYSAREHGHTIHPASDFLPASFYEEAKPETDAESVTQEKEADTTIADLTAKLEAMQGERDKALAELADEKLAKLGCQQEITDLKSSYEWHQSMSNKRLVEIINRHANTPQHSGMVLLYGYMKLEGIV